MLLGLFLFTFDCFLSFPTSLLDLVMICPWVYSHPKSTLFTLYSLWHCSISYFCQMSVCVRIHSAHPNYCLEQSKMSRLLSFTCFEPKLLISITFFPIFCCIFGWSSKSCYSWFNFVCNVGLQSFLLGISFQGTCLFALYLNG